MVYKNRVSRGRHIGRVGVKGIRLSREMLFLSAIHKVVLRQKSLKLPGSGDVT